MDYEDDEYWEELAYDTEPIECSECGRMFWSWREFDWHICL